MSGCYYAQIIDRKPIHDNEVKARSPNSRLITPGQVFLFAVRVFLPNI